MISTIKSTLLLSLTIIIVNAADLRTLNSKVYVGTGFAAEKSDTTYHTVAAENFNCLTPENAMKWGFLEPTRGQVNYGNADQLITFAQQNTMKVRGHTLIWHNRVPDWATTLSKTDLEAAMKKHINDTVTHFKGKIYAWDVVNEILNDDGSFRDSIWHKNFGQNYVTEALQLAHAADPNAKMYINEYGVEAKNKKSDALLALVKSLKTSGVPIDGVGFQSHLIEGQIPGTLAENMKRFSDAGFDVAITELDIRIKLPSSNATLTQQAKDYETVFKACLSTTRCPGVTVWSFSDKYTNIPNWAPGYGEPDIFDASFKPKAAFSSVETALKSS